jgi:hypothetical protein
MNNPNDVHWTNDLEDVMADLGERCLCYRWLHSQSEKRLSKLNDVFAIPVIILSTVSGSANIGSQAMFPSPQASIAIGFLSIFVGILSTIQTYFSFAKQAENHKMAALTYGKIHDFLRVELSLPREERMAAKDLLKTIRDQTDRLAEISPQIPDQIIDMFKARFATSAPDVSKPEITNGLDPIKVNRVLQVQVPE